MATTLKNIVIKNVGTSPIDAITTGGGIRATILGISFTNLLNSFCYVDILIRDDTSQTGYYLKDSLLPETTSLRAVSTGEKLVLAPNNVLQVRSSVDDSVDVIISYVEIT